MSAHKPIKFEKTLDVKTIKEIENIIKNSPNAKNVLNATLAIIAVGGILTIGAVAPNLASMILKMNKNHQKQKREKYNQIWHSFNTLKKNRALEFVREDDDGLVYRLSDKGKEKIRKFMIDELSIKEPKYWDEKWRLVIFDIPEHRKQARNALARKLKELDFYQCQKSVWIHPFPCVEEIEFIKDVFQIKPFVKIFTIDEMDDGKTLHHFGPLLKQVITK